MEAGRIEHAEVDGRRLAWRVVGSGEPLLLVNGYASTGSDWDPTFLAALAESFEVICPDNRGMGESQPGDGALTIDAIAADLEVVLAARGVEACPVVGWSMGGFAAQRLAETAPGRVTAQGLICTDAGGSAAVNADAAVWHQLTDHSGTPREQASRLIALLFPPALAEVIDAQFGELVAEARAAMSVDALLAQEEAMVGWHREERQPPPRRPPTLILHGSEDRVIPAANAALLAERWRGEPVELFEGCGHGLMAQQPAELASRLREFFVR